MLVAYMLHVCYMSVLRHSYHMIDQLSFRARSADVETEDRTHLCPGDPINKHLSAIPACKVMSGAVMRIKRRVRVELAFTVVAVDEVFGIIVLTSTLPSAKCTKDVV